MFDRAIATLGNRLGAHLPLSKDRLETLVLLVTAMLSARTVNLSHLAAERPGRVKIASTYRRFQRFFQYVRLGRDWSASLVAEVMGLSGSWYLALDRTQWRIGAHDVNFLVLAAVTRRFRVPLMWTVIRGPGCSDTGGRIALMRRYLKVFEAGTIRLLLADREFVGRAWIDFLCENNIPFAIRLKGDLRITTDDGAELTLEARVHARGRGPFAAGSASAASAAVTASPLPPSASGRRASCSSSPTASRASPSPPTVAAGRSNACSVTPRPAASTSRTPG